MNAQVSLEFLHPVLSELYVLIKQEILKILLSEFQLKNEFTKWSNQNRLREEGERLWRIIPWCNTSTSTLCINLNIKIVLIFQFFIILEIHESLGLNTSTTLKLNEMKVEYYIFPHSKFKFSLQKVKS